MFDDQSSVSIVMKMMMRFILSYRTLKFPCGIIILLPSCQQHLIIMRYSCRHCQRIEFVERACHWGRLSLLESFQPWTGHWGWCKFYEVYSLAVPTRILHNYQVLLEWWDKNFPCTAFKVWDYHKLHLHDFLSYRSLWVFALDISGDYKITLYHVLQVLVPVQRPLHMTEIIQWIGVWMNAWQNGTSYSPIHICIKIFRVCWWPHALYSWHKLNISCILIFHYSNFLHIQISIFLILTILEVI